MMWTGIRILAGLLSLTGLLALTTEEQALLQFAGQLSNFNDTYSSSHWQGWGKDSNALCPSADILTDNEYLCFPDYPGEINATSQSWTGVVCTANGTVLCISLPSWGLTGNVNALEELAPLQDMQLVNLANNSLTAIWGDSVNGWGQYLQGLYLDTNQLTGQLPLLWSESNSLSNLYRVDLFLNKLTGSVAWNPVNLPSLGNLVLLPGNKFCGTVPTMLDGVVRDLTAIIGDTEVLTNVTKFSLACDTGSSISKGAIAGAVLGSVAGVLLAGAMWIFLCRCRQSNSKGQPASIKWPFARQHKGQPAVTMSKEQQMVSKLHSLSMTSSNANLLSNAAGNDVLSEPGSRTVSFNEVGV